MGVHTYVHNRLDPGPELEIDLHLPRGANVREPCPDHRTGDKMVGKERWVGGEI
jgi:hypothetical protein